MDKDRRKQPRCSILRRCWCESNGTAMHVLMLNMSRSGAFLKTAIPLSPGKKAALTFDLPAGLRVEAEAEVVWASRDGRSTPGMGMRFVDVTRGREDLDGFIETCLRMT